MISRFADWLSRRMVHQQGNRLLPPGAGSHFRIKEENGADIVVVARGDSFDVFQGRDSIYAFPMSPRAALGLARYVIRWWIFSTWCGFRTGLWAWCLRNRVSKPRVGLK